MLFPRAHGPFRPKIADAPSLCRTRLPPHHVERVASDGCETEVRESLFHLMKEAGHEEVIAQLHLEHLQVVEHGDTAAAQDEIAQRCGAKVEFFKRKGHWRS